MDLSKLPRWFLVLSLGLLATLAWFGMQFNAKAVFADMAATKTAAFEAKNLSETNQSSIVEVKASILKMENTQEKFRQEYREDQKDLYRAMKSIKDEIITAVKA